MALTFKERFKSVAVIWAGCLAVFLLAFLVFLMPQEKAKARLASQLVRLRGEAALARQVSSENARTRLEQEITTLEDTLNQFVVNLDSAAYLPFEISHIAKSMDIDSLSLVNTDREGFLAVEGCNRISAKPLHLSFTSSFNRFAGFLNALERYRPAIFADTFSITRSPGDASDHQVDMKLLVLVPERKAKQKRPSGSARHDIQP